MNKYQETYERLTSEDYKYEEIESVYKVLDVLKPLVEKATPKKAIKSDVQNIRYITKYECPNCGGIFTGKLIDYCYHCGQAIDWSDRE